MYWRRDRTACLSSWGPRGERQRVVIARPGALPVAERRGGLRGRPKNRISILQDIYVYKYLIILSIT